MKCKIKNYITILSTIVLLLVSSYCFAGNMNREEASAFAAFIQQLTKTTHTPKQGKTCAFGYDEISKMLYEQDSENFIDLDQSLNLLSQCKVVYIARDQEKRLKSEIEKFNHNKIFTVAVFDGFTEMGGMIQVQMGRRNFELIVNAKELKTAGIRLSALVTSLIIN